MSLAPVNKPFDLWMEIRFHNLVCGMCLQKLQVENQLCPAIE